MKKNVYPWERNEQGFLIGLVGLALFGLFYLFSDFMLPLVFAVVITCATYPLFELLLLKTKNRALSSGIMVGGLAILVILPAIYLFSVSAVTIFDLYDTNQDAIKTLNFTKLVELKDSALSYLPLPENTISFISSELEKNAVLLFNKAKEVSVSISKEFLDNSMGTVKFLGITLFSMFFFFRDGENIVDKIKIITPLNDDFDDLLLMELYSLCGILTVSVFTVAFIQGVTFGMLTSFMDVNWLFIAIAIAVSSFIPIVGSLLVWIPLAIYFFVVDQSVYAIIILLWGAIVNGVIIDNIMRPWIIGKICVIFDKNTSCDLSDFNPLDNLLIIILSTFGALKLFGVVGLFLGPIIAAISITILDLYILRIQSVTDSFTTEGKDVSFCEPEMDCDKTDSPLKKEVVLELKSESKNLDDN